jgi:hypothetical protein
MATVCPNCEAVDSLEQEVTVSYDTTRKVKVISGEAAKPTVTFGEPDRGDFHDVTEQQMISCSKCGEEWDDAKHLLSAGPYERRCTDCDWWGFVPWQHGVERPECEGTVHRVDEDAEVAA